MMAPPHPSGRNKGPQPPIQSPAGNPHPRPSNPNDTHHGTNGSLQVMPLISVDPPTLMLYKQFVLVAKTANQATNSVAMTQTPNQLGAQVKWAF